MLKSSKRLAIDTPRILLIDIETVPGTAYIWNMFDDHVPLERLITPGRAVCAAFKTVGVKGTTFVAEWHDGGRLAFLTKLRDALDEADAVVTYNGEGFDFPTLLAEFVMDGLQPPAPITSIDLYKTVKKMRFMSRKLEYIAPLLGIGKKVKHEGFRLWKLVMDGDEKARKRMERYNVRDTTLLEKGYKRLRPYMYNHPTLRATGGLKCTICGSTHLQHRGYRYTKQFSIERVQCMGCGSWPPIGKRTKFKGKV